MLVGFFLTAPFPSRARHEHPTKSTLVVSLTGDGSLFANDASQLNDTSAGGNLRAPQIHRK